MPTIRETIDQMERDMREMCMSLGWCQNCFEILRPGNVFPNGYNDDGVLCHLCKAQRNHELEEQLTVDEGWFEEQP